MKLTVACGAPAAYRQRYALLTVCRHEHCWFLKNAIDIPYKWVDNGLARSSPAVSEGMVYFGSFDGYFYALDAATLQPKWVFPAGGIVTPAAIADDTAFFGSSQGYLYAVNTRTGQERWKIKVQTQSPAVYDGVVYFSDEDNLYAADASTGVRKWKAKLLLLLIAMLTLALVFSGLNVLGYLLWFVVFVWLVIIVLTLYGLSQQRALSPTNDLRLQANDAPFVSVLVPARNEADRVLEESISSLLAQDYGRFEVIAVNDRSTDATGAILRSIASADARLQVIEGEESPRGWLGKPNAMRQALKHARGEWILATDADMIFDKAALRTAVAKTLEREADAMTFIPHFEAGSFWERVILPTWAWALIMFTILYRVNNPKARGAVGIGGFFLMRRALLERVGNYEALRDEVLEDVRLAEMIKRAGGTILTEYAPSLVSTRMYRNFGEMWECCTKSWFSGMKFSLPLAMSAVFSIYLIAVMPALVAIAALTRMATGASATLWPLLIPAALAWLMQVIVLLMAGIKSEISPAYALTAPLGLAVLYAMLFDSSMKITMGKGVSWKGRRIYESAGVSPPDLRTVASRKPR